MEVLFVVIAATSTVVQQVEISKCMICVLKS